MGDIGSGGNPYERKRRRKSGDDPHLDALSEDKRRSKKAELKTNDEIRKEAAMYLELGIKCQLCNDDVIRLLNESDRLKRLTQAKGETK